jgi:hypothetical protein
MSRKLFVVLIAFGVVVAACGSAVVETTTTVRENPKITVTYDWTDCA